MRVTTPSWIQVRRKERGLYRIKNAEQKQHGRLARVWDLRTRARRPCYLFGCTQVPVPSAQISFFQIVASFLSVSINHRHASNDSARCGVLTAITTDGSPNSTFPVRCRMTSRTIG